MLQKIPPARPDRWIRNLSKAKRNNGESYVSRGIFRPARKVLLEPCGKGCRLHCTDKITENQRQQLLNEYWSLENKTRKHEYIMSLLQLIVPKYSRKKEGCRRGLNFSYNLMVNGEKINVCSKFFKATLNLSGTLTTVMKKFRKLNEAKIDEESELREDDSQSMTTNAKNDDD